MVVEYIRYKIPADLRERFLADYARAAESLDQSAVCLAYELTQCEEEPERFIVRIEWTSTEDHLKKFRGSAEFRSFLPFVQPYFTLIEEMQHYSLTPVVRRK